MTDLATLADVPAKAAELFSSALPDGTPDRERLAPLYSFLAQLTAMHPRPAMERAVLLYGAPVPVTTDPEALATAGLTRGQPKDCAANTSNAALRRPDLLHVEGFATALIPVWHCWPSRHDGTGFDITWQPEQSHAAVYVGLPFDPLVAATLQMARGYYGVLPDTPLDDEWLAANVHPVLDDWRAAAGLRPSGLFNRR